MGNHASGLMREMVTMSSDPLVTSDIVVVLSLWLCTATRECEQLGVDCE